MGVRGRRPAADCPDCRFSRVESLVDVEVDGHPPIIGRLVAYKLPDCVLNSLFTKTTISGRYCRSRFVELSGSSSAPIRARSDWRFGAARLPSC